VRLFTPIRALAADFEQRTEITLQEVPNRGFSLRLFVDDVEKVLLKENNRTWKPAQRLYVLDSPLNTITKCCACVDLFLRHPRYTWTPEWGKPLDRGQSGSRPAVRSTLDYSQMIIGTPTIANLQYRVSRGLEIVRSYLIEKPQMTLPLESIVDLWIYNSPQTLLYVSSQLPIPGTNRARIGFLSALVAS
jgi:hypothetical protein